MAIKKIDSGRQSRALGEEDILELPEEEIQKSTILYQQARKSEIKKSRKIETSQMLKEEKVKESPRVSGSEKSKSTHKVKASIAISEATSEKWDEVGELENISKVHEAKMHRV